MDKYAIGTGQVGDDSFEPDDDLSISAPDPVSGLSAGAASPVAPVPQASSASPVAPAPANPATPHFLEEATSIPDFLKSDDQIQPVDQSSPANLDSASSTNSISTGDSNPIPQDISSPLQASGEGADVINQASADEDFLKKMYPDLNLESESSDVAPVDDWDLKPIDENVHEVAPYQPIDAAAIPTYDSYGASTPEAATADLGYNSEVFTPPVASYSSPQQNTPYIPNTAPAVPYANAPYQVANRKRGFPIFKLMRSCLLFLIFGIVTLSGSAYAAFEYYKPTYKTQKEIGNAPAEFTTVETEVRRIDNDISTYYNEIDTQMTKFNKIDESILVAIENLIPDTQAIAAQHADVSSKFDEFSTKYADSEVIEEGDIDVLASYLDESEAYIKMHEEIFSSLKSSIESQSQLQEMVFTKKYADATASVDENLSAVRESKNTLNTLLYSSSEMDTYKFTFYYFQFFEDEEKDLVALQKELERALRDDQTLINLAEKLNNFDSIPVTAERSLYAEFDKLEANQNLLNTINKINQSLANETENKLPEIVVQAFEYIETNTSFLE